MRRIINYVGIMASVMITSLFYSCENFWDDLYYTTGDDEALTVKNIRLAQDKSGWTADIHFAMNSLKLNNEEISYVVLSPSSGKNDTVYATNPDQNEFIFHPVLQFGKSVSFSVTVKGKNFLCKYFTDNNHYLINCDEFLSVKSFNMSRISFTSVTAEMEVEDANLVSNKSTIGFRLADKNGNIILSKEVLGEKGIYRYSSLFVGLDANTEYLCQYFVIYNGVETDGEWKTFNTLKSTASFSAVEVKDVLVNQATLSCRLNPGDTSSKGILSVRCVYFEEGSEDNIKISPDFAWTSCNFTVDNLKPGTKYNYRWEYYLAEDQSANSPKLYYVMVKSHHLT